MNSTIGCSVDLHNNTYIVPVMLTSQGNRNKICFSIVPQENAEVSASCRRYERDQLSF